MASRIGDPTPLPPTPLPPENTAGGRIIVTAVDAPKPTTPKRIQRQRTLGWRMPEGAVYVGRPTHWGNPFRRRTPYALMRTPGAADPTATSEYEGRISADGARHDYFHPDGRITHCTVRYMTAAESVEHYRRLLTGDLTPAMISAGHRPGLRGHTRALGAYRVTVADVVRDLAGHDLACWCPLDQPCHADVLLEVANGAER